MKLLTVSNDDGKYYYWLSYMGLHETKIIMLNSHYESNEYHEKGGWINVSGVVTVFHVPYIWPSKYWRKGDRDN